VEANGETFHRFAGTTSAQGVLALVRERQRADLPQILGLARERKENGMILLLDHLEDPQNIGALIRTAECAGWHGVVLPKHESAPVSTGAIKASAGATEHMRIAEVANLVQVIEALKRESY